MQTSYRASALIVVMSALAACSSKDAATSTQATPTDSKIWSGGLWVRETTPDSLDVGTMRADNLPLTPEWRAKSDQLNRIREEGGVLPANDSQCIPSGMPFMMIASSFEFLYSPDRIGIVTTGRGFQARNILLNRAHTPDEKLFESFSGESIGHWEGDTLVVDTIGIRSTNELLYALKGTQMHVSERMHLLAPDRLEITTTVEDPKALATPWTYTWTYKKNPNRYVVDNYCVAAFDRSVDPRTGEQGFDLTPPPEEGIGVPQAIATH
ncbi:MAG: hypothetical protein QM808_10705 [Steroidobacteraceae bacterium]